MRLLVTGGRDFKNFAYIRQVLNMVSTAVPLSVLIHGDAPGVDRLCKAWASQHSIPVLPYPADWDGLGPSAGPIRNSEMLLDSYPDIVVSFPGNTGTRNMKKKVRKAGVFLIDAALGLEEVEARLKELIGDVG